MVLESFLWKNPVRKNVEEPKKRLWYDKTKTVRCLTEQKKQKREMQRGRNE